MHLPYLRCWYICVLCYLGGRDPYNSEWRMRERSCVCKYLSWAQTWCVCVSGPLTIFSWLISIEKCKNTKNKQTKYIYEQYLYTTGIYINCQVHLQTWRQYTKLVSVMTVNKCKQKFMWSLIFSALCRKQFKRWFQIMPIDRTEKGLQVLLRGQQMAKFIVFGTCKQKVFHHYHSLAFQKKISAVF